MQNDNATTYDTYLQVQNELQSAVNELRDELAIAKFGRTYKELEDLYDRNSRTSRCWIKSLPFARCTLSVFLRLNRVKDQPTTDMGKFKKGNKRGMAAFQRPPSPTSYSCCCSSSW